MTRRETDPRAFLPGTNVEALVSDQSAADRARAKIEGDSALREAVQGFSAEGSLPPYLPEAGAKVAIEAAPAASRPRETPESSVVIAPRVLVPPTPVVAESEPAQELSPGGPESDVLVALPPAPVHDTTRRLAKPQGATAFLRDVVAPPPTEDEQASTTPEKPKRSVRLVALPVSLLLLGLATWLSVSTRSTPTERGAQASGAPTQSAGIAAASITSPAASEAPAKAASESPVSSENAGPSAIAPSVTAASSAIAPSATPASAPGPSVSAEKVAAPHPSASATAPPASSAASSPPATSSSASAWKPNW